MLTPIESFWLRWHAEHDPPEEVWRAQCILQVEAGAPMEALAQTLQINVGRLQQAQAQFSEQRLSAFTPPRMTPEALLEVTQADSPHARHVAGQATTLFDQTRPLHRLPGSLRTVLEAAALLHAAGGRLDPARAGAASSDLVAAVDLDGFTPRQQRLVAGLIAVAQPRTRPEKTARFASLTPKQQGQLLILRACLCVANSLDHSQSQSTCVQRALITPKAVTLRLQGPRAEADAGRLMRLARPWEAAFHLALRTSVAPPPPPDPGDLAAAPLSASTSMSALALKTMAGAYLDWQANVSSALAGDLTPVRALEAAARTWRAALWTFAPYLRRRPARQLRGQVKQAEAALGQLGKWQRALDDIRAFQIEAPEAESTRQLQTLIAAWEKESACALAGAHAWLNSAEAADLQVEMANCLDRPRLRHDEVCQTGLGKTLAATLQSIEARRLDVAPEQPKSYSRLRRSLARLEQLLEISAPLLGPETQPILEDLSGLTDELEKLVELNWLDRQLEVFLDQWAHQQAKRKAPQLYQIEAVVAYQHARRAAWERQALDLRPAIGPRLVTRLRRQAGALMRRLKA